MDEGLSLRDVASCLRLSYHTVYRMKDELGATKVSGQYRISEASVRAHIEKHTIPARNETRSQ